MCTHAGSDDDRCQCCQTSKPPLDCALVTVVHERLEPKCSENSQSEVETYKAADHCTFFTSGMRSTALMTKAE